MNNPTPEFPNVSGPKPPGDNGSAYEAQPLSRETQENIRFTVAVAKLRSDDAITIEEETLP